MLRRLPLLLALALPLVACGPKKPVTDWYYSAWASLSGADTKEMFEEARQACLARSGVRDPAAVERGSPTEREFIDCMIEEQWCAPEIGCE